MKINESSSKFIWLPTILYSVIHENGQKELKETCWLLLHKNKVFQFFFPRKLKFRAPSQKARRHFFACWDVVVLLELWNHTFKNSLRRGAYIINNCCSQQLSSAGPLLELSESVQTPAGTDSTKRYYPWLPTQGQTPELNCQLQASTQKARKGASVMHERVDSKCWEVPELPLSYRI